MSLKMKTMQKEKDSLSSQLSNLRHEKQSLETEMQEKVNIVQELENEIEEFTINVSENMIKICDHEDIMNQELANAEKQGELKFQIFQSENQMESDSLFDQMKSQYDEQH